MATDPVAWLVAVTFALGIEAPVGSTTAPVMAPCSTWARQMNALATKSNEAVSNAIFRDIRGSLFRGRPSHPRLSYTALYHPKCEIDLRPRKHLGCSPMYSQARPVATLD